MPRKLDAAIGDKLKEYGFGSEAVWDCHGVWVVYHRVLEKIAAKAEIQFEPPMIVEASGANGIAAVCVTGVMDDKREWSIGEASPKNNKNAYPWAMAEKRAKDRVILKLIGLHGEVYSEEEADDFKPAGKAKRDLGPGEKADEHLGRGSSAYASKKDGLWDDVMVDMRRCISVDDLRQWWDETRESETYKRMPVGWRGLLKEEVEKFRDDLKVKEAA